MSAAPRRITCIAERGLRTLIGHQRNADERRTGHPVEIVGGQRLPTARDCWLPSRG
jgi:hypothetical protein